VTHLGGKGLACAQKLILRLGLQKSSKQASSLDLNFSASTASLKGIHFSFREMSDSVSMSGQIGNDENL
jgi:hypothetical protein